MGDVVVVDDDDGDVVVDVTRGGTVRILGRSLTIPDPSFTRFHGVGGCVVVVDVSRLGDDVVSTWLYTSSTETTFTSGRLVVVVLQIKNK